MGEKSTLCRVRTFPQEFGEVQSDTQPALAKGNSRGV